MLTPHNTAIAPVPEGPEEEERPDEIGRKIRRVAGGAVAVLFVGFLVAHHHRSEAETGLREDMQRASHEAPIVDVVPAKAAATSVPLSLPAETAAWYDSTIYARVDGYVGKWTADIGDHVTKGQVLATIETPDLDSQLVAAQAKLKAGKAFVASKRSDADFAKSTNERWKSSPKGVVSEEEREGKQASYTSALAQLNQAEAQVGLDQAEVDRYTTMTQFKEVTAPYDGTITERRVDIGNLVTAGSNASTTPLFRMAQTDPIRVFVDVPQSAVTAIKDGQPAEVKVSTLPGKVFKGTVTRTADAMNPQSRTLRVEIDIPNADHELVSGLYVDASFAVSTAGLVEVPAAALLFRRDGPHVITVDEQKHIHLKPVSIARDNGSSVDLDSGAKVGELLALNISSQIEDGSVVTVNDLEAKKDEKKK